MRRRQPTLRQVVPLVLVALAGCGGGSGSVVAVTGTLTYKGKPVTNAYVDFVPAQGRPSWGLTDGQGHFKLNYDRGHDGAIVGKHKVSARTGPQKITEKSVPGMKEPTPPEMAEFFAKYGPDKSPVEVTIDKNTKDLKLDWN
jgi:hypothetical protein